MKLRSVSYLSKEGIKNMWANRLMTAASIGVLVACMVLIGLAILVSLNLNVALGNLEQQNVIRVFDWSGNFVKEIALSIPATIEPENISVIGNRLFIGCNNSKWTGGELYYCYLKEIK
jgi:hypothetical protein